MPVLRDSAYPYSEMLQHKGVRFLPKPGHPEKGWYTHIPSELIEEVLRDSVLEKMFLERSSSQCSLLSCLFGLFPLDGKYKA